MAATYRAARDRSCRAVTGRPDARAHGWSSSYPVAGSHSGHEPPPTGTAAQKLHRRDHQSAGAPGTLPPCRSDTNGQVRLTDRTTPLRAADRMTSTGS